MTPKCIHGVYSPKGDGTSYACSGCAVPDKGSIIPKGVPFSPFPGGVKRCPSCGEKKRFKYVDEWQFHCGKCGEDALDPNGR